MQNQQSHSQFSKINAATNNNKDEEIEKLNKELSELKLFLSNNPYAQFNTTNTINKVFSADNETFNFCMAAKF